MTVDGREEQDALKFLDTIKASGLNFVRLNFGEKDNIVSILKRIVKNEMKVYLVPFSFKSGRDCDAKHLQSSYLEICSLISPESSLGIALPHNSHLLSQPWSKAGLGRGVVVSLYNNIVDDIKASGHRVTMPITLGDIHAENWRDVRADVFDVPAMLSAADSSTRYLELKRVLDREIWFGQAGRYAGTLMPSQQLAALNQIRECARCVGAKYAFLHSDSSTTRFHWSVGGRMLINVRERKIDKANIGGKYKENVKDKKEKPDGTK